MTRNEILQGIKKQLEWRGPNGKSQGHVVLTRDQAIDLMNAEEKIDGILAALLENDPSDQAADAVTCLDVWRKEIMKDLKR